MKKYSVAFFVVFVVGTVALWGGGKFWEKREHTQWSEKEVLQIMNKSPWVRRVELRLAGRMSLDVAPEKGDRAWLDPDRTSPRRNWDDRRLQWEAETGNSSDGIFGTFESAEDKAEAAERSRPDFTQRRIGPSHEEDSFLVPVMIRWYALPIQHAISRWEFLRHNRRVGSPPPPESITLLAFPVCPPNCFPAIRNVCEH